MRRGWAAAGLVVGGLVVGLPRWFKAQLAPPARPISLTPSRLDLHGEQVWLTSRRGTRLHGWLIPAADPGPAPALVVLHGWGANASLMLPMAPYIHRAGYHALFLDARNHGLSEHDDFSSMPRFAEDLGVAVEWLHDRSDVTRVGAVAHSVGAGALILAASERDDITAGVVISPFADPVEIMTEQTWVGEKAPPVERAIVRFMGLMLGYDFSDIAPINRIARVQIPLLLAHGSLDEVVPVNDTRRLAMAKKDAEVLIIHDAHHSDVTLFEPHVDEMLSFLKRYL